MIDIEVTERWREAFSGGQVGVLLLGNLDNSQRTTLLEEKRAIEAKLRAQFQGLSRAELLELEVLKAYRDYYKRFDKTYHVQLQLESVLHKNKPLPSVSPLVDANFMAELQTLVLTAGHDADLLEMPLSIDGTLGGESFVQMNGAVQSLKAPDMMMRDRQGIVCTILYGQDQRTPISSVTRRALYVAYAPAGVPNSAVRRQLELIRGYVALFSPEAVVELETIYAAKPEHHDV